MMLASEVAHHHIWLGFSAWDQPSFDAGWPHMRRLQEAGWNVWVSAEPWLDFDFDLRSARPDWLVAGGESGPGSQIIASHAVDRMIYETDRQDVPFWFKQFGGWRGYDNMLYDGSKMEQLPKGLEV